MDKHEARQVLRRINEIHFELDAMRKYEEELKQHMATLRKADFPVGLIHADFIENCGRYVFIDDLTR